MIVKLHPQQFAPYRIGHSRFILELQDPVLGRFVKASVTDKMKNMKRRATRPQPQHVKRGRRQSLENQLARAQQIPQRFLQPLPFAFGVKPFQVSWTGNHDQHSQRQRYPQRRNPLRQIQETHDRRFARSRQEMILGRVVQEFPRKVGQPRNVCKAQPNPQAMVLV